MVQPKLGIDFDGVLHDSVEIACETANKTFRELGIPPMTVEQLKTHITSDWVKFFNALGIPKEKHGLINPLFKEYEKVQPLGNLIKESYCFFLIAIKKYGQKNIVLISNSQEQIIKRFFVANGLPQITILTTHGNKAQMLKDNAITTYVGDVISDGEAAVAAGARFVAVMHDPAHNNPDRLVEFKKLNPNHEIYLAKSLQDAARYI